MASRQRPAARRAVEQIGSMVAGIGISRAGVCTTRCFWHHAQRGWADGKNGLLDMALRRGSQKQKGRLLAAKPGLTRRGARARAPRGLHGCRRAGAPSRIGHQWFGLQPASKKFMPPHRRRPPLPALTPACPPLGAERRDAKSTARSPPAGGAVQTAHWAQAARAGAPGGKLADARDWPSWQPRSTDRLGCCPHWMLTDACHPEWRGTSACPSAPTFQW